MQSEMEEKHWSGLRGVGYFHNLLLFLIIRSIPVEKAYVDKK